MTAINPQDFIDMAADLCTDMGESVSIVFTRKVDASYSVSTAESTETTPITYTVKAAIVPISTDYNDPDVKEMPEFNNIKVMKTVYIPGVDVNGTAIEPKVNDTAAFNETYRVLHVTPYRTQSTMCAYMLLMGK